MYHPWSYFYSKTFLKVLMFLLPLLLYLLYLFLSVCQLLSFYSLRVFHTSISWLSFTGVYLTGLQNSSEYSSWINNGEWFRFFLWFPIHLVFFSRPLETAQSGLTIGITITLIFHFFNSLSRSKYLSIFSVFLYFHSAGTTKSIGRHVLFFHLN